MRDLLLEHGPSVRRGLLLVVTAGVPLLFLRVTKDAFGVPKLGLLMMGLSLVAGLRVIEVLQGTPWKGLERLALPGLVFIVPLLFSWVLAPYKYWSLFGWYPRFLGLIPYIAVVLYGVLMADAFAGRTRIIAWTFAITGTIVGFYGMLQVIGADPFAWNTAGGGSSFAISTFGNSNFVGTFLAMCLPFFIPLWIEEERYRTRLVWMAGLVASGCVASLSEPSWAAGASGGLVVIGFVLSSRWGVARRLGILVPAGSVVLLAGIVFYRMFNPGTGSVTYRGYWWRAAGEMATHAPLFGRGPAAFALEGIRYRPQAEAIISGYGFPDDPHSVALSLLTAAGVFGLVGFLFVLGWALWKGYPAARDRLLPAAFLASVLVYFVNSVTLIDDIPLRVALWAALGGLAASIIPQPTIEERPASRRARTGSKQRAAKRRKATPRRGLVAVPAVAVATLVATFAFLWSARFVLADARVAQGEKLFLQGRVDEARLEFQRSIGFREDYSYRQLYGLYLGVNALEEPRSGRGLIREMDGVFAFVKEVPYVPAIADYARRLYEWGEFEAAAYSRALDAYEEARELDPLNPTLAIDTADVLIALGQYEEAIGLLESFEEVAGDRSDLYGALSLGYFRLGRIQEAKRALATALSLNPADERARRTQELMNPAE